VTFSAIHQITAGFAAGDAISLEAVALRDACRALGVASDIFVPAERTSPDTRAQVRPLEDFRPAAGELLVYHYSIQSPATEVFQRSAAAKVVIYHNITPAEFFRPFDAAVGLSSTPRGANWRRWPRRRTRSGRTARSMPRR
jgi:hypothetical protein